MIQTSKQLTNTKKHKTKLVLKHIS